MMDALEQEEWFAWRAMCNLLAARGINVNDPQHETLVRVIRHYAASYRHLYEKTKGEHREARNDRREAHRFPPFNNAYRG